MRKAKFIVIAALLLSLVVFASATFASITTFGPFGDVTFSFSTPNTYESCRDVTTTDVISTSGVPANWQLFGWVRVDYVTASGRQVVQTYNVNQFGDLNLEISYPPVSQWPVFDNNGQLTQEIHVDIGIEVRDENGFYVYNSNGQNVVLGPGSDWDVYCLNYVPTTPPPPPSGEQGCTPGFWKNNVGAWDGINPNAPVTTVFANASFYPEISGSSLVEALDFGGGPKALGAAKNLLRAATAAYLNAANADVGYPVSTAQIVNSVNTALATQNRAEMLNLAQVLDTYNNLGCPLSARNDGDN